MRFSYLTREQLEVRIFEASYPQKILQVSLFGDSSRDYRIDSEGQLYITNFKTSKTPAVYEVEVWRPDSNFKVGGFTFSTMINGKGDFTKNGKTDTEDLMVLSNDWLTSDSLADIAPPPDGDGIVNILDFVLFAEEWLSATSQ